jgi:hypothetical protein
LANTRSSGGIDGDLAACGRKNCNPNDVAEIKQLEQLGAFRGQFQIVKYPE